MRVKDILVPMDFSTNAVRALEFAVSMADPSGEIYLLHVVDADFASHVADAGFSGHDEAVERMRQTAEQRLGDVTRQHADAGVSIQTMIVVGKPFAEILRVASDLDFEMIVLGTYGSSRGDIEELLFGSTAEKVLRGARIPVVCVPGARRAED
jgi:nucleotide-binding universal stress UspA family protein